MPVEVFNEFDIKDEFMNQDCRFFDMLVESPLTDDEQREVENLLRIATMIYFTSVHVRFPLTMNKSFAFLNGDPFISFDLQAEYLTKTTERIEELLKDE